MISFIQRLEELTSEAPFAPAVTCANETISRVDLLKAGYNLAVHLHEHGTREGDMVTVAVPNSIDWFIGYIASHAIAINGTSGTVTEVSTPLGRGNSYGMTDTCYKAGSYSTGLPALPSPTTLAPINGADARHIFGLKVTQ